jgi:enterochelin esterase-like enzyme
LGIPGTADPLIQGGRIPALVLVMPEDQGEPLLEAAVLSDLLPALERGHPGVRDRQALGGLRSGATRALELGLERPDLFASIALYRPELNENGLAEVEQWSAAIPGDLRPRVYLDAVQGDPYLSQALSLRSVLDQAGVVVEGQLRSGTNSDQDWGVHLEGYLLWYSQSWR